MTPVDVPCTPAAPTLVALNHQPTSDIDAVLA
jgi:hypothetical protein